MTRYERPYRRPTEFTVMCPDCGDRIYHKCHSEDARSPRAALLHFLTWVPEFGIDEKVAKAMQKHGEGDGYGLEKGDDFSKYAFFGAQPWSYSMGGKHFGREFSGVVDQLIQAFGFDPHEIRQAALDQMEAKERETEEREEHRAKVKGERADAIKLFRSKAPLSDKINVLDAIIAKRTLHQNPLMKVEDHKSEDPWLYNTLETLERYYGGGIAPDVNKMRIEAARKDAIDRGIFLMAIDDATGRPVFKRRFKTAEECEAFRKQTYVAYDATSQDPFASGVILRTRQQGEKRTTYMRGPKGWIEVDEDALANRSLRT
jgi:hypothetical protein